MSTLMIVGIAVGAFLALFVVGDEAKLYFARMTRGFQ